MDSQPVKSPAPAATSGPNQNSGIQPETISRSYKKALIIVIAIIAILVIVAVVLLTYLPGGTLSVFGTKSVLALDYAKIKVNPQVAINYTVTTAISGLTESLNVSVYSSPAEKKIFINEGSLGSAAIYLLGNTVIECSQSQLTPGTSCSEYSSQSSSGVDVGMLSSSISKITNAIISGIQYTNSSSVSGVGCDNFVLKLNSSDIGQIANAIYNSSDYSSFGESPSQMLESELGNLKVGFCLDSQNGYPIEVAVGQTNYSKISGANVTINLLQIKATSISTQINPSVFALPVSFVASNFTCSADSVSTDILSLTNSTNETVRVTNLTSLGAGPGTVSGSVGSALVFGKAYHVTIPVSGKLNGFYSPMLCAAGSCQEEFCDYYTQVNYTNPTNYTSNFSIYNAAAQDINYNYTPADLATYMVAKPVGAAPQGLPANITAAVEITLSNNQDMPTAAPFQQLIAVNSSDYSPYESQNLENVRFFYPNGTVIPSWLESNNSADSNLTLYWLNLRNGIPADSEIDVYMGFGNATANFFNSHSTGEAPQLSNQYGKYDDGANVFSFYDNFRGTALNSSKWADRELGVVVNDGITFSTDKVGQYIEALYQTGGLTAPFAFDFYGDNLTTQMGFAEPFIGTTDLNASSYGDAGAHSAGIEDSQSNQPVPDDHLYALLNVPNWSSYNIDNPGQNMTILTGYVTPTSVSAMLNYGYAVSVSGTYTPEPFVGMASNYYGFLYPPAMQWIRIRAYPPDGVMPSVN